MPSTADICGMCSRSYQSSNSSSIPASGSTKALSKPMGSISGLHELRLPRRHDGASCEGKPIGPEDPEPARAGICEPVDESGIDQHGLVRRHIALLVLDLTTGQALKHETT